MKYSVEYTSTAVNRRQLRSRSWICTRGQEDQHSKKVNTAVLLLRKHSCAECAIDTEALCLLPSAPTLSSSDEWLSFLSSLKTPRAGVGRRCIRARWSLRYFEPGVRQGCGCRQTPPMIIA